MQETLDFSGLPDEIDASVLSRDTNIAMCVLFYSLKLYFSPRTTATGMEVGSNTRVFIMKSYLSLEP